VHVEGFGVADDGPAGELGVVEVGLAVVLGGEPGGV
jgi:hypothetical protein